ncbi:ComE operon protein 1 [Nonomuraea coxensis DSM 45129]|uniref:ComE operon protein 1 n=2 Tax=Nonomuraea coxensis TaxID=404386 RepID=A0ABX8TWS3_9ACTN|nr:ComE operon protein 1 [Nonomuraea coxensis DSM 45129]
MRHDLHNLTTQGQQLAKDRTPRTRPQRDNAPLHPTNSPLPIHRPQDVPAVDTTPDGAAFAAYDDGTFYSDLDPSSPYDHDHDPNPDIAGFPLIADDADPRAFPLSDSGNQRLTSSPRHPSTGTGTGTGTGPAPIPPSFQAFRAALASRAPSLDPGRPGLRVLLAIGALAVAVAVYFVWQSQPTPQPLPPPRPATSATPTAAATKLTVHVTGKVRKPGVYLLPAGTRVADAVTAAGGPTRTAATGSLNLARRLIDGEQIVVGAPGASAAAPGASPADPILDLNAATTDQLEELPGVGEVLAARIAEFRTAHGGFTSVEQLREVSGIGVRKYAEIKPKVRV